MTAQICGQSPSPASRIAKADATGRSGSAMRSAPGTAARTPAGNKTDPSKWLHSLILPVTAPASPPIFGSTALPADRPHQGEGGRRHLGWTCLVIDERKL